MRRSAGYGLAVLAAACVAPAAPPSQSLAQVPRASPAVTPSAVTAAPSVAPGPTRFEFAGELTQGGWIRGQAPAGTTAARLGERPLTLDPEGRFFAAFDRDQGPATELVATLTDGSTVVAPITVAPRAWQIERVNTPMRPGNASPEEFTRVRQPELARIAAAREQDTGGLGWRQDFIWPATGRISGRFGSQRIYRGGEAGSYHSGLDVAGGAGTPYMAPADGVVVLAAQQPFSLEGYLLIIDHGQGLNSAFLHSSELSVREGDRVRQGQVLGKIGATGRATGPHLHWSLMWRGARLDPLLFTGPMP